MKYRHGDVGLVPVSTLPKGVVKEEGKILAYGEVTGHTHRFDDGDYQFWKHGDTRYIEVLSPSTLNHEEHGRLTILPGVYEQIQEREYDYFNEELRAVVD